jgi:hypothetical protein
MPVVEAPVLTHDRLVPGRLVHRRSLSDVLVTEAHVIGDDVFLAGLQWPRNHRLFGRGAQVDVALVAESIRQLTIYLAHAEYEVPLGHAFLMGSMRVSTVDRPMNGVGPDLAVTAHATEIRRSARGLVSFVVEVGMHDAHGEVARGSAEARVLDPRTYARTRRGRTVALVVNGGGPGRDALDLLAPIPHPGVSMLVVDTTETVFFDHPLDHVPGMLLIEAARQAIRAAGGPELAGIDAVFGAVVELDEPCAVVVVRLDDDWLVRFDQGGVTRTSVIGRGASATSTTSEYAEVSAG